MFVHIKTREVGKSGERWVCFILNILFCLSLLKRFPVKFSRFFNIGVLFMRLILNIVAGKCKDNDLMMDIMKLMDDDFKRRITLRASIGIWGIGY